ncbi:putative E3 ubiquitin-protein ligase herc1 [Sarracenia purpurea var. burkii]
MVNQSQKVGIEVEQCVRWWWQRKGEVLNAGEKFVFGDDFVIALTEKGEVYSWGWYEYSKGLPTKLSTLPEDEEVIDVACGSAHVMVFGNGYLFIRPDPVPSYAIGNGYSSSSPNPAVWTKINFLNNIILKIAAGKYHVIALDDAGAVFVWGSNENGELTSVIVKYQPSPVKLPNIPKK